MSSLPCSTHQNVQQRGHRALLNHHNIFTATNHSSQPRFFSPLPFRLSALLCRWCDDEHRASLAAWPPRPIFASPVPPAPPLLHFPTPSTRTRRQTVICYLTRSFSPRASKSADTRQVRILTPLFQSSPPPYFRTPPPPPPPPHTTAPPAPARLPPPARKKGYDRCIRRNTAICCDTVGRPLAIRSARSSSSLSLVLESKRERFCLRVVCSSCR